MLHPDREVKRFTDSRNSFTHGKCKPLGSDNRSNMTTKYEADSRLPKYSADMTIKQREEELENIEQKLLPLLDDISELPQAKEAQNLMHRARLLHIKKKKARKWLVRILLTFWH
jgi:hypothetical protein